MTTTCNTFTILKSGLSRLTTFIKNFLAEKILVSMKFKIPLPPDLNQQPLSDQLTEEIC